MPITAGVSTITTQKLAFIRLESELIPMPKVDLREWPWRIHLQNRQGVSRVAPGTDAYRTMRAFVQGGESLGASVSYPNRRLLGEYVHVSFREKEDERIRLLVNKEREERRKREAGRTREANASGVEQGNTSRRSSV